MPNLMRMAATVNLAVLRRLIPRLSQGDQSFLARQLMQDRYARDTCAMAFFMYSGMATWKNKQFNVHKNGEAALLKRLAGFNPQVILDVGANVGEWSVAAATALPEASIHAFEIEPETAEKLASRLAPLAPRVMVNRCGLGDREGDITVYVSPERRGTATSTLKEAIEISAPFHGIRTVREITAKISTGDTYIAGHEIDRVSFLKIDVEGAEMSVLNGFSRTFADQRIDMVQFEYGDINLGTRIFLADFYKFFSNHGFSVGKIYPEGVAFKPYETCDEDFVGPNYLACHTSRRDIIQALCCPPLESLVPRKL